VVSPTETRGYLNNNPGNIDRGSDVWQGEIRDPNDPRLTPFQRDELTKRRFCVFASPEMGIRAIARNLIAYYDRLGHRTIRQFINTWAPPIENNTAAYIARAAKSVGVGADDVINVRDYAVMYALVEGIINVECAGMPYKGHEIEDGLRLAGIVKPVSMSTSKTAQGAAVATGATAAQIVVTEVQDQAQSVVDALGPIVGTSHTLDTIFVALKIGLAVVALVGIALMFRERLKRQRRDAELHQ
jgi:hypothetical protein